MGALDWLGHRALFAIDPETAHGLPIRALKRRPAVRRMRPAGTHARRAGLPASTFPIRSAWRPATTRTAKCPDALLALGFGFAEIGTVTPLPQPGNDRSRAFSG